MKVSITIRLLLVLCSCSSSVNTVSEEILKTEQAFQKLSHEKGLAEAFASFADEDAVIHREGKLIQSPESIKAYYSKFDTQEVRLLWSPDTILFSKSEDLAFSYGKYQFIKMSTGDTLRGYFQTVWKRQPNGEWKYIWD